MNCDCEANFESNAKWFYEQILFGPTCFSHRTEWASRRIGPRYLNCNRLILFDSAYFVHTWVWVRLSLYLAKVLYFLSWPRPWAGIRINVLGYLWACVLFFVLGWAQSELAHVRHVYVLLDWIRDHLWKKITEHLNPLLSFSPRVRPVAQFFPKISPILLSLPSQISRSMTLSLRKVRERAHVALSSKNNSLFRLAIARSTVVLMCLFMIIRICPLWLDRE